MSPGNYSLSVLYDPNNTSTGMPSEPLGDDRKITVNATLPAPYAPTLAGATATSITLKTLDESVEYSMDNINWQDSPTFDGLAPTPDTLSMQGIKEITFRANEAKRLLPTRLL